jgi:hypothetical protein
MKKADLERQLVRCRYLINKGAVHRLGLRDLKSVEANWSSFIPECHLVYKRAQGILTATMLQMESEIQASSDQAERRRLKYWLRVCESCYESFLWVTLHGGDVSEVYKGPKFGDLAAQNVESVLGFTKHFNKNPYAFAIPLDFTRYSCVADVLTIKIAKNKKKKTLQFLELKQGDVNDAMLTAAKTRTPEAWKEFLDKYGEKGFKQAKRFFRAGEEFYWRTGQIAARPGVYKTKKRSRVVSHAGNSPQRYTSRIENLCDLARRGEYAVEIIDKCLLVAALDATEQKKYTLAQFDARLLVVNAFLTEEDTSKWEPDRLVAALKSVQLTNWLDGLGSVGFFPPLLRPIRTRNFLDLFFGRVELLFYFHAPSFVRECRLAGVNAGFLTKKHTNRLRANQHWRANDYPLWDGRALAFVADGLAHPLVMGSLRLHEMMFNWTNPTSVIENIAQGIANLPKDSFSRLDDIDAEDLENS